MLRHDYLIVGAGFAGSVCAERLASAGKRVLLIDQRSHIGGNACDEYDEAGILRHRYGAHIFHCNDERVFQYLSRFTEWRPYEHRVLSSYNGQLLPVPINQTTLDAFNGDLEAAKAALYAPYTAKQWGPHADKLSSTVLARVQPRPNRDDRYFTDRFQAMPAQGYTKLFERMLDHPNIEISLNTPFFSMRQFTSGPEIVWTGPIDEFFVYCYGKLPYRSARFQFETLDQAQHQSVGVVNYPSAAVGFTRITEFKHLTGQVHHRTTIALEYPQAEGEPFWPVPTEESAARYRQYQALAAQTPGVHFVGRLGSFRYLDMWQVVAQALKLSESLIQREPVCQASSGATL